MSVRIEVWGLCLGVACVLGCTESTPTTNGGGGSGTTSQEEKEIICQGSSSLGPVTEIAAARFEKQHSNYHVGVSKNGTGKGVSDMIAKELDVCDASRPLKKDELAKCKEAGIKFYELPVCYDALTVVIHPSNDWAETMTVEQLGTLWRKKKDDKSGAGEVATWDQVDPSWPKEKVKLYGADSVSGTYEYFGEAVAHKEHRTDYSASANDNQLVDGVAGNKFSIGYIPYTYYAANKDKVKAVKIVAEGGTEGVEPSPENIKLGKYTPLARPLFLYVPDYSATKPEVKEFVEFYITNGKDLAENRNYLPLSPENYEKCLNRFKEGKMGSVFGGESSLDLTKVTADELFESPMFE